jgi:16S rRNA (guanine527-N7)-methyltransferase
VDSDYLNILQRGLDKLEIEYQPSQLEKTKIYLGLLKKWNQKYNLVADANINVLVEKHVLDSLLIFNFVNAKQTLDIGTGAGFPGIPLAIFKPQQKFTLLDSNGKKTRFLFQVKTKLGLNNAVIENCRIENYQSPCRIDMVTCRAFGSLEDIVIKSQHLLSQECKLLAMKGKFPDEEISRLPEEFIVLDSVKLLVPGEDSERHLIQVGRKK